MESIPAESNNGSSHRLSLFGAVAALNAEYVRTRNLDDQAYKLCLADHDIKMWPERYERIRREYSGVYRLDHPTMLREKPPGLEHTFCVVAAAEVVDQDSKISSIRMHSNVGFENLLFENAAEESKQQRVEIDRRSIVTCERKLALLMKGIVIDDAWHRAGTSGLLLAAACCQPELLALDVADDSHADSQSSDMNDSDQSSPITIQPGVVFCRAKHILSDRDFDLPPDARVAVVSERHVLIVLLAANPSAVKVHDLYSFAWPRNTEDDGGARVFVMRRKIYRDLLYIARQLTKHLLQHLVPLGAVQVQVKEINKTPTDNTVRLIVRADYVRIASCSNLLYRAAGAGEMFRNEVTPRLWMCMNPSNRSDVLAHRMADPLGLFRVQTTFAKGLLAAGIRGETIEEAVLTYVQSKEVNTKNSSAVVSVSDTTTAKIRDLS